MGRHNVRKCSLERDTLRRRSVEKRSMWRRGLLRDDVGKCRLERASLGRLGLGMRRASVGRLSLGWTSLARPCRCSVLSLIVGLDVVPIVVDLPWKNNLKKEKKSESNCRKQYTYNCKEADE